MKQTILLCLLLVFISSCNKNQRRVNKISGKWNVVSADIAGYGTADPDLIYEFEYCKMKNDEFCEFSVHNFDTDEIITGAYRIVDTGTKLGMTISSGFGFEYVEYDIVKSTNRKLILENLNVSVGQLSRIEMRRVE